MDKLKLTAFVLLTLGIIFDEILILFFLLSISSLIILSIRRVDVIRVFLSAMLIGFLFEKLGLTTGFPFGHYAYHFPPYLLGVPVFVIFGWGIFSYISYLPVMDFPFKYRVLFFPILMVIIDLSVDPIMVTAHYWTWISTYPNWYGIPLTNFLGWYLVSFIISLTSIRTKEMKNSYIIFLITYFLFSLKFLIFAKPQLIGPLSIATSLALLISIIIFVFNRLIVKKGQQGQ
jgi:uncharacterized membrane protein